MENMKLNLSPIWHQYSQKEVQTGILLQIELLLVKKETFQFHIFSYILSHNWQDFR